MSKVTGVVEMVKERNGVSKKTNQPYTIYSALVNGEWYGHGFDAPIFQQGAAVEFETRPASNPNYTDIIPESVKVLKEKSPEAKAATSVSVDRNESIMIQSAYERAIMLVDCALRNGLLKPKGKEATHFDLLKGMVDEEAIRLLQKFRDPATAEQDVLGVGGDEDVVISDDDYDPTDA